MIHKFDLMNNFNSLQKQPECDSFQLLTTTLSLTNFEPHQTTSTPDNLNRTWSAQSASVLVTTSGLATRPLLCFLFRILRISGSARRAVSVDTTSALAHYSPQLQRSLLLDGSARNAVRGVTTSGRVSWRYQWSRRSAVFATNKGTTLGRATWSANRARTRQFGHTASQVSRRRRRWWWRRCSSVVVSMVRQKITRNWWCLRLRSARRNRWRSRTVNQSD